MKNVKYLIIVILFMTTFIAGIEYEKSKIYKNAINPEDVISWNTDQEELRIILKDGSEWLWQ